LWNKGKLCITAANVELDNPVELHASHWAIAEKVVKAHQVYEEATHEASDNHSSAAIVIPIVNNIFNLWRHLILTLVCQE